MENFAKVRVEIITFLDSVFGYICGICKYVKVKSSMAVIYKCSEKSVQQFKRNKSFFLKYKHACGNVGISAGFFYFRKNVNIDDTKHIPIYL